MFDFDFDPDYDHGKAATMPAATECTRLWIEATKLYAADALAAAQGKADKWRDRGQALRDLRGNQRMLARLCEPLGADVEAVARAIETCIERGHGAGLHPSKPRRPKRKQEAA
jgi:hypothetical protein